MALRKAPLEKDFQRRVMRDLRRLPKSWWHKVNDRVATGVLDVHGGVNGLSVVIELKTRSKLTKIQLYNLEKAHAANCQAFVGVPENWPDIYAFLWCLVNLPPPPIGGLNKPERIPHWTRPPVPRKKKAPALTGAAS